jgi:hypothetical protein
MLQMEEISNAAKGKQNRWTHPELNDITLNRTRKGEKIAKSGAFVSCHDTPSKVLHIQTWLLAKLSALIKQYHQPARNTIFNFSRQTKPGESCVARSAGESEGEDQT